MKVLITVLNALFICLTLFLPVFLHIVVKKKDTKRLTLKFFLFGLPLMILSVAILAAWTDMSNLILLNHYGYRMDGMNYENVLPQNRERVDRLLQSIMGIGWPLKAIFGSVMIIPYLVFVYFGKNLYDKIIAMKNEA
ncbi:MAG: hypothetical protein U0T82_07830 [Bacteroidales bacterium]